MSEKFNDAKWRREQLIEGKGYDLAKKYIAKLRQEFRKLSDEELDEFNEEIANAFGYKLESISELNEGHTTTFSKEEMAKLHKDGTLEKDGHTYVFTND